MSADPFAVVTVRKSGRATPPVDRPQQEDDPFAAVQVQRPKSLTKGQLKDVMPMKVGAPSFKQFFEASEALPQAPMPAPKTPGIQVKPFSPMQEDAPSFKQFFDAGAKELPAAPTIPTGMGSPMVTRAKAPTKIEQTIARAVMQGTRKTDPFGAGEMTDEQRAQLDRANRASAMANALGEFGVQGAGGYVDAYGSIAQGLGSIADVALPGTPVEDAVRRARQFVREDVVGQPETAAGVAGQLAGSLYGTVRAFMTPAKGVAALSRNAQTGTALQRALQLAANPIGRAGLTEAGRINRLGQFASGAALSAPINVAMGLSPESAAVGLSELGRAAEGEEGALAAGARAVGAAAEPFAGSAAGRVGFELLSDIVPSALLTGAGGAASKAVRAAKYIEAQRLAKAGDVPGAIAAIRNLRAAERLSGVDDISKATAPMDMPTVPKRVIEPLTERPTIAQEVRSVGSDGFVVLPPNAQGTDLAVEREHLSRMNMEVEPKIQQLAPPHTRAKEGAGLFDGDISPNALFRFSANVADEDIRKAAAVRGLVYGQQAQLWYRPAREGDEGTSAAFYVYGKDGKDLSPEAVKDILAAAKENGIFGATKDGNTLSFLNIKEYTELSDEAFNEKMGAAIRAAADKHDDITAHQSNIYSEFLNGTSAYVRALGPASESLLGARNAIVAAAPEYIRYARAVGADAAVTEQRIAARLSEIDSEIELQRVIDSGDEKAIQKSLDNLIAKELEASGVQAATPPTAPVVEAPVKAEPPPITRPEKGPLSSRAPDFSETGNYVLNLPDAPGFRIFKNSGYGELGDWYIIDPYIKGADSLISLAVYTRKEAEEAALEYLNRGRRLGYTSSPVNGRKFYYPPEAFPVAGQAAGVSSALAGKAFDVGGALGEGVSALAKAPGGKAQLAKVGLGTVGYGLSESEDERLQAHGNALMGLAAYSLVHGKVKQGARAVGATVAQELAKSPAGRRVLDEVSLDIRVDPRVKETVDVALREMAKYRAIGRELAAEAAKRGGVFDRVVSDLVEKEAIETGTLSPEDMEIAIALAQKIADNSLGLKKVEARLMSADTYAKRGTAYLPRRYAKYEAKDVTDVAVQHKGKTFRISGEKIRNDDLTLEEREALGEIREASYRIADYFGRGSKDIATAHLFEALSEIPGVIHPDYVSAVKEAAVAADLAKVARTPTKAYRGSPTAAKDALRAAEDAKARAKALGEQFKRQGQEYVTLPDTPQLGVLRGAVVRKDAAAYLNDLPDFKSTNRMYNRLMHYWKSAHTVFNIPGTHITNMASNVFMGILGGLPFHEQVVAIPRAIKDIIEYGPTTRFLTEAGVIDRALPTYGDTPMKGLARDETVLRSLMRTTRPSTREALEAQGLKKMGWMERGVRKIGGGIQQAYSLEDTMFRVALFDKLSKQGMTNEDALKEIMRVFPGYDTRSPILQKLKHISPFVMYPAKYLPAALNLIAENPWRWVLASATWAAIDQASRSEAGAVREEDLPANRRFGKGGYLIPGPIQTEFLGMKSKEAGKRMMFDVGRFTPFTALTGSPAPGTTVGAISQKLPAIVQPSGPILDIVARLGLNVEPFSGKPFKRDSDEPMDILQKLTVGKTEAGRFVPGLASSLLLPSSLSYHLPNIAKDLYYGDTEAAKMSTLGLIGGRPIAVKRGQQAGIENWKLQQKIREVNDDLQDDLRASRDMVVRRNLIKKAMEKRQRIISDYRKSRQP